MSRLDGRTALVAGGAGFLGSHLCQSLVSDGAVVICLDNFLTGRHENLSDLMREPRFDLVECDVASPPSSLMRGRARFDQFYDFTLAGSLSALAENRDGVLVEAADGVDSQPERRPQDASRRKARVRVARLFNTYGPRMRPEADGVLSTMVMQALAGAPLVLQGAVHTHSPCYVDDTVRGLRLLAEHPGPVPAPVDFGGAVEVTMRALAEHVLTLSGSTAGIHTRPPQANGTPRRRPDLSVAADLLGWSPTTPLDLGLRATIGWFLSWAREPEMPGASTIAVAPGRNDGPQARGRGPDASPSILREA